MTLKKTELLELKKSGKQAILAKLNELRLELNSTTLKVGRGEIKNIRSAKTIRRTIAQLKTMLTQLELTTKNQKLGTNK